MYGDKWNITKVEGGFTVDIIKTEPGTHLPPVTRVFSDSSTLLTFLHNELVGSN